jgi:FemAB-related protein (PEP-CTERM system-associated)
MSGSSQIDVSAAVDRSAWDAYVASHPRASGYHLSHWRDVFEGAFGHETRYLAASRDGRIAGVLPLVLFRSRMFGRFIVSLPFVNYGGVLADDEGVEAALLREAERTAAGGGFDHVELRHRERRFPGLVLKQHKVAMLLPLAATVEAAWGGLDRKVRNQIRKAEKSELTAVHGGPERLEEFYSIFARNMRDLGTPVYSRSFFAHVMQACGDRASIAVVMKGSTPIAAGISLSNRGTVEVPWASSVGDYRALCPNHLLYWSVIKRAIEQRFDVLDFGRSTPDEGTYHFKKQWGAEALPLCWEYRLLRRSALPDHSPKNPKYRTAIEAWKRCPLWLTNTIGPRIVRSIP